jgi:hypothetical protein
MTTQRFFCFFLLAELMVIEKNEVLKTKGILNLSHFGVLWLAGGWQRTHEVPTRIR